MENYSAERTQRTYARLAGFLFLWLIVTAVAGLPIISHIVGSGTFAETAKRVAASEHLYRLALFIGILEPLSTVLLAFALFVILKPIDELLAQMAMCWRLGEAFIGGMGSILGFLVLRLYTSPQSIAALGPGQSQALVDLTNHAGSVTTNISAIFFSIGSTLFFYVFLKSTYIPRILSAFGVFASVIVAIMLVGNLIFPEYASTLQYVGANGHRRAHNRLLVDVSSKQSRPSARTLTGPSIGNPHTKPPPSRPAHSLLDSLGELHYTPDYLRKRVARDALAS